MARRARPRAPAGATLLSRARRRGRRRHPAGRPPPEPDPAPVPGGPRQRAPGAATARPRHGGGQQPANHGRSGQWLLVEPPRMGGGRGPDRGGCRLPRERARRHALFLTPADARTQDGAMRRDAVHWARARRGQQGFGLVEILVVVVILAVIGTFLYQYFLST